MFRLVFLGLASLACSLNCTSHAEMDQGCVAQSGGRTQYVFFSSPNREQLDVEHTNRLGRL